MNERKVSVTLTLFLLLLVSCQNKDSHLESGSQVSLSRTITSSDLFIFTRKSMKCLNSEGKVGRNLEGSYECADFKDEDWSKKDFTNVSFRNSKLEEVNFYQANLSGADFSSADLTSSSFFKTKFTGALFDEFTKLPEGFNRESIIKLGGVFKDYKKLDLAFTEAILQGKLEEASRFQKQMAILDQSFYGKTDLIINGPFKDTMRYLNSIGVDFSTKGPIGITLFQLLLLNHKSKISRFMELAEELIYQIERAKKSGLSLDEIWSTGIELFGRQTPVYSEGQLEVVDIFLKIDGVDINRRVNNQTIASKLNYSKDGLDFILSRGFNISSVTQDDTVKLIVPYSTLPDDQRFQYISNLERLGWDFKRIEEGRIKLLDHYIYDIKESSLDPFDLKVIDYLGLRSPELLRKVPRTLEEVVSSTIKAIDEAHYNDSVDLNGAKPLIEFFRLKELMQSLDKNLFLMLPLTVRGQWHIEINSKIFYHIERLSDLGFPLNHGQESFLHRVLEVVDKYSYADTSHVKHISKVLELYRKTETAINPVYNDESILFYQKKSMYEYFSDDLDFTVKDRLGRSLYWRLPTDVLPSRKSFEFLQAKNVPIDLFETIDGKTLFEELYQQLQVGNHWMTEKDYISFLINEAKLLNFNEARTLEFVKSYSSRKNDGLSLALYHKLKELKLVKNIRFVRCSVGNASIFLEDPRMNMIDSIRSLNSNGGTTMSSLDPNPLVIIQEEEQEQINDYSTKMSSLVGEFGIRLTINRRGFEKNLSIMTDDFQNIKVNGTTCTNLSSFPATLKRKFRFAYLKSSNDVFALNLLNERRIEGLRLSINDKYRNLSLVRPASSNEYTQMWPVPLKDHLIWQMIGLSKFDQEDYLGPLAFPMSVLENPKIGTQFNVQYIDKQKDREKIKNFSCTIQGLSY